MKIIDLLNKIANGEEVPKRIYYKGDIWYLEQDFSNRLPYYKNGYSMNNLLSGEEKDYFSHALNDEVEILEEEKKIPEKLNWNKNDFTYPEGNLMSEETADMLMEIQNKVNFILDYLKSTGE